MENQPSEQTLKEIARQLSCPEGSQGIKIGEMMNVSNIGMTQATIAEMHLNQGDFVLEIGHGNGGHIEFLLSKANDLQYFGADISEIIITEAEKLNADFINQGIVTFKLTDGETLPFENEFFDKICTVNTIYFWKNPQKYLQEIKRVLKPGGLFVLCFADKSFMEKLPFTKFGFNLYDEEKTKNLFEESGIKLLNSTLKTEEINNNAGFMVSRNYHLIVAVGQD